jgi:hypothetical protein
MTKEMLGLGNILIIAKSYLSGVEFAASGDLWSIKVIVNDRCVIEPIQWGDTAPSLADFEFLQSSQPEPIRLAPYPFSPPYCGPLIFGLSAISPPLDQAFLSIQETTGIVTVD